MKFKSLIQLLALVLVFPHCQEKPRENESTGTQAIEDTVSTTSAPPVPSWDYSKLYGVYFFEGNNGTYASSLTLEPQGLNIAFKLVTTKGKTCRAEANGNIALVNHTENFDTGYWITDDCGLEFSFQLKNQKVDVKEVNTCTLHNEQCLLEGTYIKRVD